MTGCRLYVHTDWVERIGFMHSRRCSVAKSVVMRCAGMDKHAIASAARRDDKFTLQAAETST